jgi:serine protease AprX
MALPLLFARGMTSLRPPRLVLTCLAQLGLLLALFAAPVAADPGKNGAGRSASFDAAVQDWHDHGKGPDRQRVIVRFAPGRRADGVRQLNAAGLGLKAEHPLIESATFEVPRAALEGLAHNPNVLSISSDAVTGAHTTVAPSGATVRSALGLAATTSSWNTVKGTGVGVAVIDSGISPSTVFGSRIVGFYDLTSGSAVSAAPSDEYGHGTHVAGLIGGSGTPSNGVYPGIATNVNLIGFKVLDGTGQGYTSSVISAIEFAVTYRSQLGIDVINLSLGHPILEPSATDPLVQAVEAASRAGIVVVASAGNFGADPATGQVGYGGITSPGDAPSAITVGSVDINGTVSRLDDKVAPYSSRGPTWYDGQVKPDVVAPGHMLTAVTSVNCKLYGDYPTARVTASADAVNKYLRLSGTSMAAAVTSGVVALMVEAHRTSVFWTPKKLTPNTVKAILQYSATALTDPDTFGAEYDVLTEGAGEINVSGALSLARYIDTSTPLGGYWMTYQPQPMSYIAGDIQLWSQHLVWGSHLVWGNSLFFHELGWEASSTWGAVGSTYIAWGSIDPTHLVWGNNIVWGSHIVWGNALVGTVDGDHIVWGNLVDAQHIVWGNLVDSEHIVWGNADLVVSNSDTTSADDDVVQEPEPPIEP